MKIQNNNKGFNLAEIMISTLVLALTFTGVVSTYLKCLNLSEMSQNSSRATLEARKRMENAKNSDVTQLITNYHNVSFSSLNVNGMGVSYVNDTDPNLLEVTISFCWQQNNGRIIGEDANLNGVLDDGEDVNGNGFIDSPVQITSYIYVG